MKAITFFLASAPFFFYACVKEIAPEDRRVEVYDFITGRPIDRAQILQNRIVGYYTFSGSPMIETDTLGYTNSLGVLNNINSFEYLRIVKEGYHLGAKNYRSIYRENNKSAKFYLFQKGKLNISLIPKQIDTSSNWSIIGTYSVYPVYETVITNWGPSLFSGFLMNHPSEQKHDGFVGLINRIIATKNDPITGKKETTTKDVFLSDTNTVNVKFYY
jgi:hypothetical protein